MIGAEAAETVMLGAVVALLCLPTLGFLALVIYTGLPVVGDALAAGYYAGRESAP